MDREIAPLENADEHLKRVSFLSQIRLGDLLTIATIIVATVGWWAKTDGRLARLDEIIVDIKLDARNQRVEMKEMQVDLRSDIKETRTAVENLSRKVERRAP